MLTPVLSKVMIAIEAMIREGNRPSLRKLAEATDRKAKSRLHENVDMLIERGFVLKDPYNRTVVPIRTIAQEIDGEPLCDDPLVLFIDRHQKRFSATTPSYQEMCEALSITSKSEVHRRVNRLLADGCLTTPAIEGKRSINRCLHVVKKHEVAA